MTIKFIKDCTFNGENYFAGDVWDNIQEKDLAQVWKLNEKSFISPITLKDFKELEKQVKNKIVKEDK